MKKLIISVLVGIVGLLMLSGCSGAVINVIHYDKQYFKKSDTASANTVYFVNTSNYEDMSAGVPNLFRNNNSKYLLQGDALTTIKNGYKYFRIILPIDSSALMLTTPKDLQKTCFSSTPGDSLMQNGFGVKTEHHCFFMLDRRYKAELEKYKDFHHGAYANIIAVYKNKPDDKLVINAQKFIDFLKANDLYVKKDTITYVEKIDYLKDN